MKVSNQGVTYMSRKKYSITLSLCTALIFAGCQSAMPPKSTPPQPKVINAALDEAIKSHDKIKAPKPLTSLPTGIRNELMQQNMNQAKQGLLAEKRLEIAAHKVAATAFFTAIVEDSNYSVAIHPEVSGEISLNLKDVTLDEALHVVEELYGYQIHRKGKIIQIYPAGIRTETIPLNYLYITRDGSSNTSINSGGVSQNSNSSGGSSSGSSNNSGSQNSQNNQGGQSSQNSGSGINISTVNKSDFWTELSTTLTALVGTEEGRSVIISPHAGLITIRAFPLEIKAVKKFISDTEEHLRRQVIIEAKIMEVTLNDDYQQGIRWDEVAGHASSTDIGFSTTGEISNNVISAAIGGVTSLTFLNKDFRGVIDLLSTQGNVQVLSSPRITATNNQKAVIKVGTDEYFVTDVSTTTTTGTATSVTPEVDLTPFFSGISLDVTPQINDDGEVILHVHPSVTITKEQVKSIKLSGSEIILPLAQSSVRESDTLIRAKSGEIAVIGGLIETRKLNSESKTPLLGDIPLFGELFKNKSESTEKKELVILLKPIVIGQDTWKNQLQDARALLKEWFPEEK